MNKYVLLGVLIAIVIAVGVLYRMLSSNTKIYQASGQVKHITMTAQKDQWRFLPEVIDLEPGDTVNLTVVNEDTYDHGIAIEAFGVSQRIPAKASIQTKFVVTKEGEFPFYCSVPCGEGIVDNKKRTHFDMIGKIRVKSKSVVTP